MRTLSPAIPNRRESASLLLTFLATVSFVCEIATRSDLYAAEPNRANPPVLDEAVFRSVVRPTLDKFCVHCHNADVRKSGVRLDQLDISLQDDHLRLWKEVMHQISEGSMPPKDEPSLSDERRNEMARWIKTALNVARSRNVQKNGSIRRLTVSQYRNTLKDLLGIKEDVTKILPPDGISKDGFANNGQVLTLSPLQIENYLQIAERALDLCIVDEKAKPQIQNFRMDLGKAINSTPCTDNLILGAESMLLDNPDFIVTELTPEKPFEYQPFFMTKKWEFIEGYAGNDTVRGWRKYDSIYHSVFACMRGTRGYPKGDPYQVVPDGLLLRPAIPSSELFGQSSTYGPMANFKISLRELPDHGDFRITVRAARYNDGLLLDSNSAAQRNETSLTVANSDVADAKTATVDAPSPGVYQVDVELTPESKSEKLSVQIDDRWFAANLGKPIKDATAPFLVVRLTAGSHKIKANLSDAAKLKTILLTKLDDNSDTARRFSLFEKRSPQLSVHIGLRRDCGSTLNIVAEPQPVGSAELTTYVFEGAINDFPSPDVEKDNVNYLAGVREIGVRSEFTDGRDLPRMLIRSIEFEGPYYSTWPPETHKRIFIESAHREQPDLYAREIIQTFASRAFRRPAHADEVDRYLTIWRETYSSNRDFCQSVKDALVAVLTSPQFLFLIEKSNGPEAEDLDDYELASKLSYFLWNSPPDARLLEAAAQQSLRKSLDVEVERMVRDPRSWNFVREFTSQWLSLDKFDVVDIDMKRFPRLTRDTKTQLRSEPVQFMHYLMSQNLPVRNLVQSDFLVMNDTVATYYDLSDRTESGFRFVPVRHHDSSLGGVLTQASILAGLSDGRESNPVKRGAWLARKIIAEPPDDPPPNVPKIKDDEGTKLSLREKLERHRNQEGCAKCHAGIDPWGVPFEVYDASGIFKKEPVDAKSLLPDGAEVADLNGLKKHLATERIDQVAFSVLKHLATYAGGRSLTYNELEFLREEGAKLRSNDYPMQDMIRFVVNSDLFLKK